MHATTSATTKTPMPIQSKDAVDTKKNNLSNKELFLNFAQLLKSNGEDINTLMKSVDLLKIQQDQTCQKINELADVFLGEQEETFLGKQEDDSFDETIKNTIQEREHRQKKLSKDLDSTIHHLTKLEEEYTSLKKEILNLKFTELSNDTKISHLQAESKEKLKTYTNSLNFCLEKPNVLQKRVETELEVLHQSEEIIPPLQISYRDELAEKMNTIHLLSYKLNVARATNLEPSITILPELRDFHIEITTFFEKVHSQKEKLLKLTKQDEDWHCVKECFETSHKQFEIYSKKAEKYESIVKKLHANAIPKKAEATNNSKKLFFGYSEELKAENNKKWTAMIETSNIEIHNLKISLSTAWGKIHKKFDEIAEQIAHLGFAEKEGKFPYKTSISSGVAFWSSRKVEDYAKVKITPII